MYSTTKLATLTSFSAESSTTIVNHTLLSRCWDTISIPALRSDNNVPGFGAAV
jgi:hypothetical protein